MQQSQGPGDNGERPSLAMLWTLVAMTSALALSAAMVFNRPFEHQSLFKLSNLVGPTTHGLLHGAGLTVCTEEIGTPGNPICFHAGRMPLPSLIVAAGIEIFGDSFLRVALFKTVFFLVPINCSIWLVWSMLPQSTWRRYAISALLLAPFTMPLFLADVVNLQVEEAYAYSLLALAAAMLLFQPATERHVAGRSRPRWHLSTHISAVFFFSIVVDALYLTKSSLVLAAAVLTAGFCLQQRRWALRVLLLLLVAAAPLGWALHQHHATGSFRLGTSLDGINLHKGNVATFLEHYPPPPGSSLDQYDKDLNRGLHFQDEWVFNDFHQRAAIAFINGNPAETFIAARRKVNLLLFSLTKYGSSSNRGSTRKLEATGLLLFRGIFWAAVFGALYTLLHSGASELRVAAATFLALTTACVLPYVVGFAYTRHASILAYLACLMCCRILCARDDSGQTISAKALQSP